MDTVQLWPVQSVLFSTGVQCPKYFIDTLCIKHEIIGAGMETMIGVFGELGENASEFDASEFLQVTSNPGSRLSHYKPLARGSAPS